MHRPRRLGVALACALSGLVTLPAAGQATVPSHSIRGPDVSIHQGRHVDWARVKRAGYDFAFVKATEGALVDRALRHNVRGLERAGLPYGAYDYARTRHTPEWDAEHFVDAVHGAGGDFDGLPPVLDVETTTRSRRGTVRWIKRWAGTVQDLTGRRPMIYTGRWFWDPSVGDHTVGLPLWVSGYTGRPPVPRAWRGASRGRDWSFWQFTDGFHGPGPHVVPGIGRSDISVFSGGLDELPLRGRVPEPAPVPASRRPAHPQPAPAPAWDPLGLLRLLLSPARGAPS